MDESRVKDLITTLQKADAEYAAELARIKPLQTAAQNAKSDLVGYLNSAKLASPVKFQLATGEAYRWQKKTLGLSKTRLDPAIQKYQHNHPSERFDAKALSEFIWKSARASDDFELVKSSAASTE